ncbi:MAG: C39 family peptidase [Pleurocapsa minor HA4230-MV1]|jgi:hypothetical protein|nr:C39 family peptidase [Pleurocapsa minor HA4230-MV1]
MDLTYSSTTLQSLETNQSNSLGGLSDEMLAHSNVLNNNSNSLGASSKNTIEYGDPLIDADYWREQRGDYSCAVVAQISVYESLTGQRISETDAADYAYQKGWFDPDSGTSPKDMDNLLADWGIETYTPPDASFANLENALARGDKPIVALDGNEIWSPQSDRQGNSLEQSDAGHAVWVTGIDYESNDSVNIILNDSGIPNGSSSVVEYDDFINAWSDYDSFVAIADNPLV